MTAEKLLQIEGEWQMHSLNEYGGFEGNYVAVIILRFPTGWHLQKTMFRGLFTPSTSR